MKFKIKMAANVEIINEATKILRPLRKNVDNFVLFENEVEVNLKKLFEKHRNCQNSIERMRNSAIEVGSIIAGEMTILGELKTDFPLCGLPNDLRSMDYPTDYSTDYPTDYPYGLP